VQGAPHSYSEPIIEQVVGSEEDRSEITGWELSFVFRNLLTLSPRIFENSARVSSNLLGIQEERSASRLSEERVRMFVDNFMEKDAGALVRLLSCKFSKQKIETEGLK